MTTNEPQGSGGILKLIHCETSLCIFLSLIFSVELRSSGHHQRTLSHDNICFFGDLVLLDKENHCI